MLPIVEQFALESQSKCFRGSQDQRGGCAIWCALFFRDPVRVTPVREGIVVAPADGRIAKVGNAVPPIELGLGGRPLPRVSIFMSVFDCHVNRSPVTGRIEEIAYHAGAFVSADLESGRIVVVSNSAG